MFHSGWYGFIYFVVSFCIFEGNNLKKAFQAVANFLQFLPEDEQMLKNKNYYIHTLGYNAEDFVPSKVLYV